MGASDYLTLPVHYRHYPLVLQYIASLPDPRDDSGVEDGPGADLQESGEQASVGLDTPSSTWDDATLKRLTEGHGVTRDRVCAVMDTLSAHPGESLSLAELADALGISTRHLNGTLSALTRHLNRHYDSRNWPFSFWWDDSSEAGGMRYYVGEERAAQWRSIRGHHAE